MSVPREIAAGSTLLFSAEFSGYPATTNTLEFILNRGGALVANIAGVADGNAFTVLALAAATAAWLPGRLTWAARLTEGATVATACTGSIFVTPNFAVSATQTASQLALAALDANIAAVLARKSQSRNFNGQSSEDRTLKDLMDARDRLYARVCAELRAAGLSTIGGSRNIVTQFS